MQKHTFALIVYLVLLHLVLAIVLISSASVRQELREMLGWRKSSHVEHYKRMLAFHRRIDSCVPEGSVLFIGDSSIQGMCVAAITDPAVNFGIGGDTTQSVLRRLPQYTSVTRARAVVLMVGYNDLRERDNEAILQNYRDILALIPQTTRVLLCSVLPTDERCRRARFNDRITSLNRGAAEICSSLQSCRFVDLAGKVRDKEGNLSRDYHEGDGIHLNSAGYEVLNEELRVALART